MAYYLVRARALTTDLAPLRARLDSGEIGRLRPFGAGLTHSLENARVEPDGSLVWEEEDYCRPPLAQEREAVLDTYFTDLTTEPVTQGEGWERIDHLPPLWPQGN